MTSNASMSNGVVIVGNGVAGYACAARLAEHGVPVTMIGPGLPHDRPPLSKRALKTGRVAGTVARGVGADAASLVARGIDHVDGLVTDCDPDHRRLIVEHSADGTRREIYAETLVWSTGLRYPKPPLPGLDRAEENTTASGLLSLVARLAEPGRRVVVVGAGLIGTETAATLASAHDVTLVGMLDRPLARFLPRVSDAASATLEAVGVGFLGSCAIEAVRWADDAAVVHTSSHGDIQCDVVVSAAGFRTSLLPELAGVDTRTIALAADEQLRVIGRERFWACGDCVSFPHPRFGRIGIPHWDHALWSGRHVAESILGSAAAYVRDPYFFSDVGPLRIQQVGCADAAVAWREQDGLSVGCDRSGAAACVLLMNAPTRLLEARELIAAAVAA